MARLSAKHFGMIHLVTSLLTSASSFASQAIYDQDLEFRAGGNGVPYLGMGWHQPESTHTWSAQRYATLDLKAYINDAKKSNLRLTFSAMPFQQGNLQSIVARIGHFTGFLEMCGGDEYSLTLNKLGPVNIERFGFDLCLEIPNHATTPQSLGINQDTRPLGIALSKMRISKLEPSSNVPLLPDNIEVVVGGSGHENLNPYLLDSWHAPESGHVWSRGYGASLGLQIIATDRRPNILHHLIIEGSEFTKSEGNLEVYFNGMRAKIGSIASGTGFNKYTIEVPGLWLSTTKFNIVNFRVKNPARPVDIAPESNSDSRLLGFALRSFKFIEGVGIDADAEKTEQAYEIFSQEENAAFEFVLHEPVRRAKAADQLKEIQFEEAKRKAAAEEAVEKKKVKWESNKKYGESLIRDIQEDMNSRKSSSTTSDTLSAKESAERNVLLSDSSTPSMFASAIKTFNLQLGATMDEVDEALIKEFQSTYLRQIEAPLADEKDEAAVEKAYDQREFLAKLYKLNLFDYYKAQISVNGVAALGNNQTQ